MFFNTSTHTGTIYPDCVYPIYWYNTDLLTHIFSEVDCVFLGWKCSIKDFHNFSTWKIRFQPIQKICYEFEISVLYFVQHLTKSSCR
jgi:hypothetical protein